MRSESSSVRWSSLLGSPLLLAAALLLALWCGAPNVAQARTLVSKQDRISEFEARHLLARLYSYSESTLKQSEDEYRRLLNQRPDEFEISMELAEVLIRLGRPEEAHALFRTLDANNPRISLGLGDALFASGQMSEAAKAYERALAAGAKREDLTLRLAQSLSWSGQADKALPYLTSLYSADPGDMEIALLYIRALNQTGERSAARTVLDKLSTTAPDSADLLFELADQEADQGHIKAARELSLKALALDNSSEARMRAAQNMNQWGAFHRAVALRQAHLLDAGPNRNVSLSLAETLSNAQRYEEAEGILRKILLDDPEDRDARLALAEIKVREKDGAQAIEILAPLTDDAASASLRARSLELLGQYNDAAVIWAESAQEEPTRLVNQGRLLLRAGDIETAREVFAKAATLAPKGPSTRYHNAMVEPDTNFQQLAKDVASSEADPIRLTQWAGLLSRDAHYDGAIICLKAALKIDPDYFPARMGLAENLAYSQRYDESLAMLESLKADFPDSSNIQLTYARVLAWSRHYEEAVAAYEVLHDDAPNSPLPLREMARTYFWDKRADEGRDTFSRLLEPPVDELLAERLEAKLKNDTENTALRDAANVARLSALNGEIYQAYIDLADSSVADSHPQLFADLLPTYRIQHSTALEQRAKLAAYNRRFAPAMTELTALTNLSPGNQEAWFDLGQAQCALGLCAEESAAYSRLLEIDPQNSLAGRALERRKLRNAPWVRAGFNLWDEKGHGNLADIVRLRNDMTASMPLECGLRIEATAHQWRETPRGPRRTFNALGGTLGVSGVFNEWLSGSASWTAKRFGTGDPRDTDQFKGRLELNMQNYARVGMAFERVDVVTNLYGLLRGTQADNFILDFMVPATRHLDVEGSVRNIQYSDANKGEAAHLQIGYAVTDHPRIFKVIVRGDYRHTAKKSQDVFTGAALTDITHPYWTPQAYTAGTVTLEWYEDMAEDFFCGAERNFLDVKVSGGTDSDTNNAVRVEAEWVLDFNDHWGVEARGLWHRSQQWDANGLWGGLRYGF